MPWARLDDAILDNPKVAHAGVLGWALYTAGIVYCARNLTDGVIPRNRLSALADFSGIVVTGENPTGQPDDDRVIAPALGDGDCRGLGLAVARIVDAADHLVALGLWESRRDRYVIHDYLEYNPSRAQVEEERENTRLRKARSRAKGKKSHRDIHRDSGRNPGHPVPVPVPVPKEKLCKEPQTSVPNSSLPTKRSKQDATSRARELEAESILKVFNSAAGTKFSSREFVLMIAKRLEEHPELTADQHGDIIRRNLTASWWSGRASPNVIYGSAAQFERAMHQEPSQHPADKRVLELMARAEAQRAAGL